jgi:RNA polymerase sigma-70 factor (ECF subfamily)
MTEGGEGRFPTTRWSVVLAAGDEDSSASRESLARLCEAYWYPVYVRYRRMERDPESARDLTQAFFADLMERGTLTVADPGRGRFRCFLTALLRNFHANERRRAQTMKRGGGIRELGLDLDGAESRYRLEPAHDETPELLFDRVWARTTLSRAMDRLRSHQEEAGTAERMRRLEPFLTGGGSGARYAEVAEELGMSEDAVKTAVHRMRKRYGEMLRAEVGETVDDPRLVDEEIRHLFAVLSS